MGQGVPVNHLVQKCSRNLVNFTNPEIKLKKNVEVMEPHVSRPGVFQPECENETPETLLKHLFWEILTFKYHARSLAPCEHTSIQKLRQ
jgi:hypothetical protein